MVKRLTGGLSFTVIGERKAVLLCKRGEAWSTTRRRAEGRQGGSREIGTNRYIENKKVIENCRKDSTQSLFFLRDKAGV